MKIKYLAVALGLLAATLSNANADRLVIKGSDTLGAKLVPQLAEQFKAQHPGTTFDIAAEGSTTTCANSIASFAICTQLRNPTRMTAIPNETGFLARTRAARRRPR